MPQAVVGNLEIATSFRDGTIEENGPLSVDIIKFNCDLAGNQTKFIGVSNQPVTDDATNYFWLDLNGVLHTNTTGYPASGALRIGRVVTSGGYISRIWDDRAFLGAMSPEPTYSGAGNPNGVVSANLGNTYRDTTNGIWYRCISNPSGSEWTVV
jgi:hypothetical protein